MSHSHRHEDTIEGFDDDFTVGYLLALGAVSVLTVLITIWIL
jgi:hypothetical protein